MLNKKAIIVVTSVVHLRSIVSNSKKDVDLNHLDVSALTDFSYLYLQSSHRFRKWDISHGLNFTHMFQPQYRILHTPNTYPILDRQLPENTYDPLLSNKTSEDVGNMAMRKFYETEFYADADSIHGMSCIDSVWLNARRLVRLQGLNLDMYVLALCVYNHDIFISRNMGKHHTMAATYVRANSDRFLSVLTDIGREVVACAVKEHRTKTQPGNIYSKVLRQAVIGFPDLPEVVVRCVEHTRHSMPGLYDIGVYRAAINHLKTKYGRSGYAFTTPECLEVYGELLEDYWRAVDNITPTVIKDIMSGAVR